MKRIAFAVLLFTPFVAFSQPAAGPAFEVASVKLHTFRPGSFGFGPGAGGSAANIHISGNRVDIVLSTFTRLVMAAYSVKDFQIVGVPATLGDQLFYDITAKVEGESPATLEQVQPMLQNLLADRFQLQFHRETKELSVYDLVVDKNGPKLVESTGPRPPRPVVYNGPDIRFNLLDRPIAALVSFVVPNVDRPVVDRTGLTGRYDFSLEYARGNREAAQEDSDRSVFAAVRALGLKLAPAKEPAEVIVIDHAERPSAN